MKQKRVYIQFTSDKVSAIPAGEVIPNNSNRISRKAYREIRKAQKPIMSINHSRLEKVA